MTAALRAACALLIVLACACKAFDTTPPAQWRGAQIEVGSERLLWHVTLFALEKQGFPIGTQLDPGALVATSGWRTDLSPFRGQGVRERAEVRATRIASGRYDVQVRVEQQVNMDIIQPLDLRYAKWEPAADDTEEAGVLLQRIQAWIATGAPAAGT